MHYSVMISCNEQENPTGIETLFFHFREHFNHFVATSKKTRQGLKLPAERNTCTGD